MAKREAVADVGLIQQAGSVQVMTAEECRACIDACRLSNRQLAAMLGHGNDHAVRNWTGATRWPCPPPPDVSAWLRSLALAHIVADAANPPPMMGDGRDAA
jgi:hypothetical protein